MAGWCGVSEFFGNRFGQHVEEVAHLHRVKDTVADPDVVDVDRNKLLRRKPARICAGVDLVKVDAARVDNQIGGFDRPLRASLSHRSNSAGVRCILGRALYAKGRLDDAIDHLRPAVALNPKLAEAHNSFGTALNAKGWLDEAIDHWRQAVNLDPESSAADNNLGTALNEKGQPDEAFGHFQQAVRLDLNSVPPSDVTIN
jgi:tetratricopeptide (TPR) repeat protein